MLIRRANLNDIQAISKLGDILLKYDHDFDPTINLNWLEEPDGLDFIKKRITNTDGIVLLALVDDIIVGYLMGGLIDPEPYRIPQRLAELEEVIVHNDYRGQDIGSELINHFFTWCNEHQASRARVVVSADNARAISLYRHFAFQDYDLILEKKL